jgi:type I restriction enzyme, S subunit
MHLNTSAEYLSGLINFGTFRPMIRQLASGSASSMPRISKGRLKKPRIPLAPLALQTAFAHQVQRIEAVARNLDVTSAAAEAMAAALSAEVFG